jgi:hypothetical protein
MATSPVVIVEARQLAGDVGRVDVVLARLEHESITCGGSEMPVLGSRSRTAWPTRLLSAIVR